MIPMGEGGTGKSHIIHAITQFFKRNCAREMLAIGAYTGIAVSLISGKTLHVLFDLTPNRMGIPSATKIHKLASLWEGKKYLIIDKFSMVLQTLLAWMSTILSFIWHHNHPTKTCLNSWGGMNVIICGDFHQFKPVIQKKGCTSVLAFKCKHQYCRRSDRIRGV